MRKTLLIPLVAAMAAATQVQAKSPELEQPFAVQSGGEILNIGEAGHAQPLFTDWDGDGLKDLLVGQFGYQESAGAVRVYKNVGSATSPKYDGFTYIEANGKTNLVPTG